MDEPMKEFLNLLLTIQDGALFANGNQLSLLDRKNNRVHYSPHPSFYGEASWLLFMARVERILGIRGWNWE
jgi:hypothetical protein